MLVGLVVGGAGMAGIALAGAHSSYWVLVAPLMGAGLGMSFVMPAATTAVMEAAPSERGGLASGTLNAARQVGGAIGVALLGALVARGTEFVGGFRIAMVVAAGAFVLAAVLTASFVDRAYPGTSMTSAPPALSSRRDDSDQRDVASGRHRPPLDA